MSWHESKQKNSREGCSERKKLWNKFHLHSHPEGGLNRGGEITSPYTFDIVLPVRTDATSNCVTPFLTHPTHTLLYFLLHYF